MQTRIDTIYLDLDDVLNTLTTYVLQWMGCPIEYDQYPGSKDIVPVANKLLGTRHTRKSFWNAVPRSVWRECPRTPECVWLIRTCKRLVGQGNVFIATSPTKDPESLAGKLEWIQEFTPGWLHRQYFITPRKQQLSRPGALLIDDMEKNCQGFVAKGGSVIRFPRPWNRWAGRDPRQHIEAGLSLLF